MLKVLGPEHPGTAASLNKKICNFGSKKIFILFLLSPKISSYRVLKVLKVQRWAPPAVRLNMLTRINPTTLLLNVLTNKISWRVI